MIKFKNPSQHITPYPAGTTENLRRRQMTSLRRLRTPRHISYTISITKQSKHQKALFGNPESKYIKMGHPQL